MNDIAWGTFDRFVARRQQLVAVRAQVEAAEDADPCARGCKCGMMAPLYAAEEEARRKLAAAEESYRSYQIAFAR